MSMVNKNGFKVKQAYIRKLFVRTSETPKLIQDNEIVNTKKSDTVKSDNNKKKRLVVCLC